jgi:hypothetical protein
MQAPKKPTTEAPENNGYGYGGDDDISKTAARGMLSHTDPRYIAVPFAQVEHFIKIADNPLLPKLFIEENISEKDEAESYGNDQYQAEKYKQDFAQITDHLNNNDRKFLNEIQCVIPECHAPGATSLFLADCERQRKHFGDETRGRLRDVLPLAAEVAEQIKVLKERHPRIEETYNEMAATTQATAQTAPNTPTPRNLSFDIDMHKYSDLRAVQKALTEFVTTGEPQPVPTLSEESRQSTGFWSKIRAFFGWESKTAAVINHAAQTPFFQAAQGTATPPAPTPNQ